MSTTIFSGVSNFDFPWRCDRVRKCGWEGMHDGLAQEPIKGNPRHTRGVCPLCGCTVFRPLKSKGWEAILLERKRQSQVEGWTHEHDDAHADFELHAAAHCYATHDASTWPWDLAWWKPGSETRNLEKAGALYLAEYQRLMRAHRHAEAASTFILAKQVAERLTKLLAAL